MIFAICLILWANFIVPGTSEELSCMLADKDGNTVWSFGIRNPGLLFAEYFSQDPISDVCRGKDEFFTAGPGEEPFTGGQIDVFGITGMTETVAQFSAECSAVEFDNSSQVLVVAVAGVGISACSKDGSQCWSVVDIVGSDVKNLFIDSCTRTCYFVDMATNYVYSVDYSIGATNVATPIGSTGPGAVGCTFDDINGTGFLNILYSDCRVERCPVDGPLSGCNPPLRSATGGNCVAMAAKKDSIMTFDNENKIILEIKKSDGVAESINTGGIGFVSGMDCECNFCDNDIDFCQSVQCLHGGTCINVSGGYLCNCVLEFEGQHCEIGPPELIEIIEKVEVINTHLRELNLAPLEVLIFDDAIFDFTGLPQLVGKEGHDTLVSLEGDYSNLVPYESVYRRLCDICFEERTKADWTLVGGPTLHFRYFRVWCFDFESLEWKIKSFAVVEDAPQEASPS